MTSGHNEVVPCIITVGSHSDLLIFVSVTWISWISMSTKYQIIGTLALSVMYYPPVHVVNILQTFQSIIMKSRWTHHTSKYWPCSYCTAGNWQEIPWAAYLANKKPHKTTSMQQKEIILYNQVYPSQQRNPNKHKICCLYAK